MFKQSTFKRSVFIGDYLSQQRKTVIFVNVENEMVVTSQKALGSFAPQQLMSRELSG